MDNWTCSCGGVMHTKECWHEQVRHSFTDCPSCSAKDSRIALLEKVAEAVLQDHDERVAMFGELELQPCRKMVMEQLRAALSRAEEAERQLCRAREALTSRPDSNAPLASDVLGFRVAEAVAALSSTSPCPHESALAELRGKVEDGIKIASIIKKYQFHPLDAARALRAHLMGGKG
jgi:hypothetical protein